MLADVALHACDNAERLMAARKQQAVEMGPIQDSDGQPTEQGNHTDSQHQHLIQPGEPNNIRTIWTILSKFMGSYRKIQPDAPQEGSV